MQQTQLHPALAKDCIFVEELDVCKVLLMNDKQYPWLILVPDRPDLKDFDDIKNVDIPHVHSEMKKAAEVLRTLFKPTKINVASLGNMVPQLHIHVIARFNNDPAWPNPIWGHNLPIPYDQDMLGELLIKLKDGFGL
ncbi:MAG: HIT domain-containing protein [Magnetococcales bacterium]|nr:HIT domain-containing protein [Magnetococcales bacterium]